MEPSHSEPDRPARISGREYRVGLIEGAVPLFAVKRACQPINPLLAGKTLFEGMNELTTPILHIQESPYP